MADNPPSEKVFVGDIPVGADEALVRQIFGVYGTVADCKVLPPRTPDSKGAALVRFETMETARWLVENVNGNIPQGMSEPVYITFAKMGSSRAGPGGYGKVAPTVVSPTPSALSPYDGTAKPSGGAPASEKLFIGDVPVGMDDDTFRKIMGKYGTVVDVKLLPARAVGEKGSALVRFSSVEEARWIVENMNGNIPEGMQEALYICFARNPTKGGYSSSGGGNASAALVGPFTAALQSVKVGGSSGWSGGGEGGGGGGGSWGGGGGYGASSNDITAVVKSIFRSGTLPGSGKKPDSNTIQVTNLPGNTEDIHLFQLFAPFGAIAVNGVKAMLNEDGTCRGIGFVDYVEASSAAMAVMTLNNAAMPDGQTLCVQMRPPSRPKYNGWE